MSQILINESFRPQRVTGQQRYAREIAERLLASPHFAPAAPTGRWAVTTARVWAWVQFVLPVLARGAMVLSMTSRAPIWRRQHVLVVHDLFVLTNPEWFSRRYVWTHAPLLRAQIRSATAVVAVSRPVAEQLEELRGVPVPVAPNAPSDVFRRVPGEDVNALDALATRGLRAGSYFLAVGSRDPRKNLDRLAAAYGRLSAVERARTPLVIVGASNVIFAGQELRWPDGTVDAGYVTDEELRQLYRGARSVVLVSKAEGFGLPLVEAAAAGAPSLLVSDIDVFRWICGPDARYVDPHSTDDILAGLRDEITSPQQQTMDPGRFTWDASAAVVADVCRRAAGSVLAEDRL